MAEEEVRIEQYLTFCLGEENFAVPVVNVREVLDFVPITRVPGMPEHIRGVLNLRGSVVPVVDLRKKFNLPITVSEEESSIIITEIDTGEEKILIGAITDSVQEVIDVNSTQIENAPSVGMKLKEGYISGMCQHKETYLIMLNLGKVLAIDELLDNWSSASLLRDAQKSETN